MDDVAIIKDNERHAKRSLKRFDILILGTHWLKGPVPLLDSEIARNNRRDFCKSMVLLWTMNHTHHLSPLWTSLRVAKSTMLRSISILGE